MASVANKPTLSARNLQTGRSKTFNFEGQTSTRPHSVGGEKTRWLTDFLGNVTWHHGRFTVRIQRMACSHVFNVFMNHEWIGGSKTWTPHLRALKPPHYDCDISTEIQVSLQASSYYGFALSWMAATTSKCLASAATAAAVRPCVRKVVSTAAPKAKAFYLDFLPHKVHHVTSWSLKWIQHLCLIFFTERKW